MDNRWFSCCAALVLGVGAIVTSNSGWGSDRYIQELEVTAPRLYGTGIFPGAWGTYYGYSDQNHQPTRLSYSGDRNVPFDQQLLILCLEGVLFQQETCLAVVNAAYGICAARAGLNLVSQAYCLATAELARFGCNRSAADGRRDCYFRAWG